MTSPATNGATLSCTISNNLIPPPATVRVIKEWDGAPASATIFVDQDGVAPFDASTVATADGHNTAFNYVAGTAVTVGETAVPTGYSATIDCGGGAQAYTGGPFAVTAPAAGATLTCTITNRQLLSTVRVVKQWVGAPASAAIFVDATGAAPYDASTVATTSGASTSFIYPVSTPVTVGETTVPAGYAATISCGALQGRQGYNGGPFPVTSPAPGRRGHHLHDHEHAAALVRAGRQAVGRRRRRSAEIFVDATGTAPYDASTTATTSGDNDLLPVPGLDPGHRRRDHRPARLSRRASPAARSRRGRRTTAARSRSPHPPNTARLITCTVTNTQQFSTVRVVKEWVGAPASAKIFVDADGAAPV